jgi:hypothetical protein
MKFIALGLNFGHLIGWHCLAADHVLSLSKRQSWNSQYGSKGCDGQKSSDFHSHSPLVPRVLRRLGERQPVAVVAAEREK